MLLTTLKQKTMPMFAYRAPTCSSTLRAQINLDKMTRQTLPVGAIGESNGSNYGYDGESYYVEIGHFGHSAFGKMKMTMEQAKAAYDAILFFDIDPLNWDWIGAKSVLLAARKSKLKGDALMFLFGEKLTANE